MSASDRDPDDSASGGGQLRRLSLSLLVGGLIAFGISVAYQWAQLRGNLSMRGPFGGDLATVLLVQLLSVFGTVALTGAVFGFLLLAMRADRVARDVPGTSVEDLD